MGRAIPTHIKQREIAAYTADMLASLKRISADNGMDLLAHLVDLAHAEAERKRVERRPS